MSTENAARERQPELFEIHFGFQEQGKRLEDCLSRLTSIGNKLEDESSSLSMSEKQPMPEPVQKHPGITTNLNNCVDGFSDCISKIQKQLSKLEKHI